MHVIQQRQARKAVSWTALTGISLLWALPIVWMALTSFRTDADIARRVPTVLASPTTEHYVTLWHSHDFVRSLWNSGLVAIGTTVVTLITGIMAAYVLARSRSRWRKTIAMFILSLRMTPPIVIVIPYYDLFRRLGVLDTRLGLLLVYLTATLPFTIWILFIVIRDIPTSLDDCARVDGCGQFELIWRFIVPAAAPGIAVAGILSFLFAWNEFTFALFLTDWQATTLPVSIAKFLEPYRVPWGAISAGEIVALLPVLLVVVFFERYIVRGLSLGMIR